MASPPARTCRVCAAPRPSDHDYCFTCGARLGLATLPSNRKGFRFAGISIHAPRLISRADRFGERRPPHTLATWLSRRWAELTLLALLLWTLQSQPWIPITLQLPTVSVKPDSWLSTVLPPSAPAGAPTDTVGS